MIRLKPTTNAQLIRILPRPSDVVTGAVLKITNEETGNLQMATNVANQEVDGFVNIILENIGFEEDTMYSVEMTFDGELWYRDKIYVTSAETTEKYHNIQTDTYTTPSLNEDNDYAIL